MTKKFQVLKPFCSSQRICIHYYGSEIDSKSITNLKMHGSIYIFKDTCNHLSAYVQYLQCTVQYSVLSKRLGIFVTVTFIGT
jgi:hypothetical protein